eukprot:CAMPEP_0194208616 /NCGR_PEP_ID=MMETSP0156-20130528/7018_1 /TAXON_ID=33649 /ORGANISM="Thalassionema nitzschioides, Strain L26-B" /LENGTH=134 /DNA_ID=CAMNT_0038935621 /DNA_START=47 /DNA_END=451 /DNA_ORIENTATION=+
MGWDDDEYDGTEGFDAYEEDDSEGFDDYEEDDDGDDEEKKAFIEELHGRCDGIQAKLKKIAKTHEKGLSKIESAMKKKLAAAAPSRSTGRSSGRPRASPRASRPPSRPRAKKPNSNSNGLDKEYTSDGASMYWS